MVDGHSESVCRFWTETWLSYGCCPNWRQAHLSSTPRLLVEMFFSCSLQSSPGMMKDVFIKSLIFKTLSIHNHSMIFHLVLIPLMSLMQWQMGHFSGSGRGMCLVRLSFILRGNTMPAFSPTQSFLKVFFLLWGRLRVWVNQISWWNLSFYFNAWEINIAQPLWFATCQKQFSKSLLIL